MDHKSIYDPLCKDLNLIVHYEPEREDKTSQKFFSSFKSILDYDIILCEFTEIPEDFIGAVKFLKNFSRGRIIVLADNVNSNFPIVGQLNKLGIKDIKLVPVDSSPEEYVQSLQDFLQGNKAENIVNHQVNRQKVLKEQARAITNPSFQLPTNLFLEIGVSGTEHKVGTTTQCFILYHYYKSLGANPILVLKEEDIVNLIMFYEEETQINGSVVTISQINMAKSKQNDLSYNVIIYDLSVLDTTKPPIKYDLSFLVSGSKPWEIPSLANIVTTFETMLNEYFVIFSFTPDNEKESLKSMIDNTVLFADYNPSLLEVNHNQEMEREIYNLSSQVKGHD